MQNDEPVHHRVPVSRIGSRRTDWLIVGASAISALAGLVVLVSSSLGRGIVNLVVALSALVVAVLAARRRVWSSSRALLILVPVVAVAGVFSSLAVREDYLGGSCGELDWPAGHLHAGYPFSWLDGGICVPPDTSLDAYAAQHPEAASWQPDLPALLADILFWMNGGILVSAILGLARGTRRRAKPPA